MSRPLLVRSRRLLVGVAVVLLMQGLGSCGGRPAATGDAEPAPPRPPRAPVAATPAPVVMLPATSPAAPQASAPVSAPDAGADADAALQVVAVPRQAPLRLAETPAGAAHPYVIGANDPNPRARSIWEAHTSGTHPERLSPLIAPKPFDPAAWARNPEAYLEVVEPGRVDQASIDPKAPRIRAPEPARITHVPTGFLVDLQVRALPHAPVSWACSSGGIFTESKYGAVTVRADANGLARVTFFASPHADGETLVLAASPFSAGQVEQVLFIDPAPSAPSAPSAQRTE